MSAVQEDPDDTIPVREAHRFDEGALADYLRGRLDGASTALAVRQIHGGQSNPTFVLSYGRAQYVLRKKPPGKLLPSAHAVDREFRIQKALAGSGLPLARMLLFCDDEAVIGTPFYVMERMRGRVFHEVTVPGVARDDRAAIYDQMNHCLATLHRVDWSARGLTDFGRPGSYFARQLSRWTKQWHASKQREIEAMDRLIEWLPEHLPDDDETTVVHGDFRLGNLMYHPTRPEVIAVFDWELSTLGHPLADIGYNLMPYMTPHKAHLGLDGADLDHLGIPGRDTYLARYCERVGRPLFDPTFHIVFSLFRMAAIVEGVMARGVAGIASSDDAERYGALTRPYAERAWAMVGRAGLA